LHAENVKAVLPDRIEPVEGTPLVGEAGGVYEFHYWVRSRISVLWVVFIDGFVQDRQFIDHQLRGPFRWYRHTHTFRATDGGMVYGDSIEFATRLGRTFDRLVVARDLDGVFEYRHRRMRELLES
jgi:ligand-binding SRPBCC domain-containing protein